MSMSQERKVIKAVVKGERNGIAAEKEWQVEMQALTKREIYKG